jgi:3-oxoacyl-[acyl-carrier protein] reductase
VISLGSIAGVWGNGSYGPAKAALVTWNVELAKKGRAFRASAWPRRSFPPRPTTNLAQPATEVTRSEEVGRVGRGGNDRLEAARPVRAERGQSNAVLHVNGGGYDGR